MKGSLREKCNSCNIKVPSFTYCKLSVRWCLPCPKALHLKGASRTLVKISSARSTKAVHLIKEAASIGKSARISTVLKLYLGIRPLLAKNKSDNGICSHMSQTIGKPKTTSSDQRTEDQRRHQLVLKWNISFPVSNWFLKWKLLTIVT